ncbi:MAG: ABC transporter ATP-binding protein [Maritimibacter sp.]|nr:ABC transporter ATP-binding protein [Maritimibacter sp.]
MQRSTAETGALLTARGVSKSYGGFKVLHEVDFHVCPGEAVGVVGPNGAGKTTLFGALAGTFPASAGEIRFAGHDIEGHSAAERCRMGLARTYQVPRPFTGLSVFENVLVSGRAGGCLEEKAAVARAVEVLEQTGLAELANHPAGTLGLLDRKRLEVARALATGPRLILLDEIGGGLTEGEIVALVELIQRLLAGGLTVVWIEHILHALMRVITRLVCMAEGRVLAEGDPSEVMAHPEVQKAYLGSSPE